MHDARAGASRAAVGWLAVGLLGACTPMLTPGYRSMHEVDGQVVQSSPPPPVAYESYLRARLALDREPPQLDAAQRYILRALKADPRDPHLWATRAEIEQQLGRVEEAMSSARRALAIRPGYPPAQRVLSRLERGVVAASAGSGSPPQP